MSRVKAYPCRIVVEQLAKRGMVTLPANDAPLMSSKGLLDVTGNGCNCAFRLTRCLPCRYIFAQRLANGLSACNTSLVDDRWLAHHSQIIIEASSVVTIQQLLSGPAGVSIQQLCVVIVSFLKNE